jgi:flotillin
MDSLVITLGIAAAIVAAVMIIVGIMKNLLYICPPDEVLIFSGGSYKRSDGSQTGFRVLFGGRRLRIPIVETVDRMSLNTMEVPITVRNAYSRGGIPLNVDAVANVKVSSEEAVIDNAIERFLGRDVDEIRRVAKETLEGHLRGVLASLTPEEVNEDRLKFAAELYDESEEDLRKLGIHLDTLKIQHVTDDTNYLDSIGREAIANVIKAAEIAESDAKRDAEQEEAANAGRANVTTANVEANVAKMRNELRRIKADLEAKVRSEEERTLAAARQARAEAEQELQAVRAELEELRLYIDQVLPADAGRVAQEFNARGDAATIRERGQAMSEALDLINKAWRDAGDAALSIYLIEELEKILVTVARGVKKVQIGNMNMIDGGDGETLAAYVGAYPAMLRTVFDAIADTTGINIPQVVSGGDGGPKPRTPLLPRAPRASGSKSTSASSSQTPQKS